MASAVAQSLFRPGPLDSTLRTHSPNHFDRDVERFNTLTPEQRGPSSLPAPYLFGRDLSRPSSTTGIFQFQQSQFHNRSASLSAGKSEEYQRQQSGRALPGLSELASLATSTPSRSFSSSSIPTLNQSVQPMPTPGFPGSNVMPVCQNCSTSTTPLWRRDESGSVLCNACGLFLKLHGRPRPISLKTDVIKSRNRVKSANQGPKKKYDGQSLPASQSEMMTPQNGASAHRRVSQMAASTSSDRSHSPVSRTGTPQDPNIAPQHLFDGVILNDHTYVSPSLPALHLGQPSPGSASSDRHLEPPMTYDQLLAANALLKTRVSELEVIHMMYSDSENNLRIERDSALQGQEDLKRRVQQLEDELHRDSDSHHPSKRPRLSDGTTA